MYVLNVQCTINLLGNAISILGKLVDDTDFFCYVITHPWSNQKGRLTLFMGKNQLERMLE